MHTFSSLQACTRICSCNPCRPLPPLCVQRRQMSGALRIVPSPEHGTSHKMRSKRTVPCAASLAWPDGRTSGKRCPSWLVTSRQGLHVDMAVNPRQLPCCLSVLVSARPSRRRKAPTWHHVNEQAEVRHGTQSTVHDNKRARARLLKRKQNRQVQPRGGSPPLRLLPTQLCHACTARPTMALERKACHTSGRTCTCA
jgi:hypothetical protein